MKFTHPAPGQEISSPYGLRVIDGVEVMHNGIDWAGAFPVLAAGDGHIQQNVWDDLFGWLVVIQHTRTLRTRYAHGEHRSPLFPRTPVKAGQVLYTSGSTGYSTGAHLHFEVWVWTVLRGWHRVDPTPYLPAERPAKENPMAIIKKTEKGTEWSLFAPLIAGPVGTTPDQLGRRVTTSETTARIWADMYGIDFDRIPVYELEKYRRAQAEGEAIMRDTLARLPKGGQADLGPVLEAVAKVPTAAQNGQAARAAIVK